MDIEKYSRAIMKVSIQKRQYKEVDGIKAITGSYNTTYDFWFQPQIADFIIHSKVKSVLDPFAGDGHLLYVVRERCPNIKNIFGYDIRKEKWKINDSLMKIPVPISDDYLIVTNPPFLAKYSAKRKGVFDAVSKYYKKSGREDLYQVALDRCKEAARYIVSIVPETFINSSYGFAGVKSCTVLTENPFQETENPVCVLCIDVEFPGDTLFYINDNPVIYLKDLKRLKSIPCNDIEIRFNVPNGKIGLRAVDGVWPEDKIAFFPRKQFAYKGQISHSSRLMTYIDIPLVRDSDVELLCIEANRLLEEYRRRCHDLLLSPFKGNNKAGFRRRRLDYRTARSLLEKALINIGLLRRLI